MELLTIKNKVYIPSGDDEGIVSWQLLTNITRHDPGERIYDIYTSGGK
jgi:hypothetical protein